MNRLIKAALAALILAIAGTCLFFTPCGQSLEETFGLTLLFQLRGPRQVPENAVIINIDDSSSDKLHLPRQFNKWPRTIHAALVDRLKAYGANVIVFDVFFAENKERHQDLIFAEAIKRAGNVILVEELHHKSLKTADKENQVATLEMDTLVPPIQPLADAPLALAPFPLPKLPVRVSTTWRFKDSCGSPRPVRGTQDISACQGARFRHCSSRHHRTACYPWPLGNDAADQRNLSAEPLVARKHQC